MDLEQIARVAHEVNRAYCQAIGDNSQPKWEAAPEWQRVSARMGVDMHMMGDFGPEASHIGWMKQKIDEGWKYGPVKAPEKKEHPCMVPFDQLPVEQQAKDFIFRAVVHALKTASEAVADKTKDLLLAANAEAARARVLFPNPKHLLHALTEEHGEVVKAALDIYGGKGSYADLDKEIVQLMAMCVRLHEEGDPAINIKPVKYSL